MRVAVRGAWLALGGPATMQLVWDRIASEVVPSSPEIEVGAAMYGSGHHTVPDVRGVDPIPVRVVSDVAPRERAKESWSVPPPSDVARIVTRRDLETSQEFAALEPLLRTNKPRKGPSSSGSNPAVRLPPQTPRRSRAILAIAAVATLALLVVIARALGLW
jgi:hypothetical protein